MKKIILSAMLMFIALSTSLVSASDTSTKVSLETNHGTIVLELNAEKAPLSVENFLRYVSEGYYEGVVFHRVISSFMIQGGGFDTDLAKKDTHAPIKNEANNGLANERGTIAMARTNAPHSASSQFFINTVNNKFLNHTSPSARGWGYAVFGKVVEGMDVVDKIRAVPTGAKGQFRSDVPLTPVIIEKALILENK